MEVDILGDATQPLRSMVDGIHRGDDRKENLGRANVAGRLLATDVLFAGLKGQAVGRIAVSVTRNTYQATGEAALKLVANC